MAKKYMKRDLSFNFGANVKPRAKAKSAKPKKRSTGPRTWRGMSYGS